MSFGIARSIRGEVRACTPDLFNEALDSPIVAQVCAEIADNREACLSGRLAKEEFETLKAKLKKRLPVFTFHATFTGGRRKNDDAVPSGLAIYDLDHIRDPRGRWAEMEARKEELGIVLAHVSPSTEGLRLVFVIPPGMPLPEAQAWMARQLGDKEYDASVKDYARCSFAVPRGYVLWVSEELFRGPHPGLPGPHPGLPQREGVDSSSGVQELQKFRSSDNSSDSDKQGETMQAEHSTPLPCGGAGGGSAQGGGSFIPAYHGLPATEIVAKYWELTGDGLPPTQGDRNTKIFDLACSLRHIFGFDRELLNRAIPNYDGFPQEEKMQCIDNALHEPRKYMPMKLTRVLQALKEEHSTPLPWEGQRGGSRSSACPSMPKKLPPLIALLLSRTPDLYKPAVAHAVFPPLGAHLHRVLFRYIDNVAHEATLMNVLMAGTGAGKDCISQPINYIMADIRRRDEENLRREREWKNEVNSKGANKDKRKRPEGLVIQEIDADMTNPAFVMRTAEADGHFLYTKMNEIDQFDALRGSGRGGQQFQIMCLAFDPGNRYGQTRVGAGSVTEKVTIRFNWNASTTIQKGKRYFRTVLTDGPVSRINFCTIPEREIGSEMPVYGTYDEAFAEELRPYIERLTKATGEVECPDAYRLAMKLKEECADRARLTQSRVYENLSFRANVIAYLKACVLYVAHGCKWSKAIEEFVRWSLEYDLWCKMEFFGADIGKNMSESETDRHKPGPRNLLELLPDTFTVKEAMDVRRMEGIGGGERETRHMLATWKSRKYVSQITDDSYKKVKL